MRTSRSNCLHTLLGAHWASSLGGVEGSRERLLVILVLEVDTNQLAGRKGHVEQRLTQQRTRRTSIGGERPSRHAGQPVLRGCAPSLRP